MGSCVGTEVTGREAASFRRHHLDTGQRSCSLISLTLLGEPRCMSGCLELLYCLPWKSPASCQHHGLHHSSLTIMRSVPPAVGSGAAWGRQGLPERSQAGRRWPPQETSSGHSAPAAKMHQWPCRSGDRAPLFCSWSHVLQGFVHFIYTKMSHPSYSRLL